MDFELSEQLARDTIEIIDLSLSKLLLMNDCRYPWVILVPRIAGAVEWHDLSAPNQQQLLSEVLQLAKLLSGFETVQKVNIGALGNVVPQLHVHVIGRQIGDEAWPKPVWGIGSAKPYQNPNSIITQIKIGLEFRH